MTSIQRIGWDGEYSTDMDWGRLAAFHRAVREGRNEHLFGIGPVEGRLALFAVPHAFGPDGKPSTYLMKSTGAVPFSGARYDTAREVPQEVQQRWGRAPVEDVDPRGLVATQPFVTSAGLDHYLSDDYARTGRLHDNSRGPSNDHPIVVHWNDRRYLLSGHHRATAALLRGMPFPARVVH